MYSILGHAKHNKKVCTYLNEAGSEFGDWVITTAYYAAIYFVCHELFPKQYDITGSPKRYHHFDDYCNDLIRQNNGVSLSKHKARMELVEEHMPEVFSSFKTLKDTCWTARYRNYIVHPEDVKTCLECLDEIEELCTEA